MAEPKNGEEALEVVLTWIDEAARDEGLPLAADCLPTFRVQNLAKFKEKFSDEFWQASKPGLRIVAGVHGRLSALFAKDTQAAATEVPFEVFERVGNRIRKHCSPSPLKALSSGDWCQWP